jgi:2-keto-4-pentenoate hydratase/2-oxohepta-3-ene-1,7-dioic acid hydratase in catechol pathway
MRLASIGGVGRERPVFVSEDGGKILQARGDSWRSILEAGSFGVEAARARSAPPADWSPLRGERFGPPIPDPSKIVAIGLNYLDHAKEQGKQPPERPLLFAKAPSCLIGAGDPIVIPPQEPKVDVEAELCVVIGRRARHIRVDEAHEVILGYTIFNDVSGREAQYSDKQWFRGKSYDTFGPCGPWIVTADQIPDPQALPIRSFWNETRMQDSNTSQLIHGIYPLIAYITMQMTLLPGDLIATGTPAGVGVFRDPPQFLKAGDRARIEIDGIGTLENPLVAG